MALNDLSSPLLAAEDTLAGHYRDEIALLRRALPPRAPHATALDALERDFEGGFSDALVDRYEALLGQLRPAPAAPLSYLMAGDTGDALQRRAADATEHARQILAVLADQLQGADDPLRRLELASATRDALGQHRRAWRHLQQLDPGATQDLDGPSETLQALLQGHLAALEQPTTNQGDPALPELLRARLDRAAELTEAPATPPEALASLDAALARNARRWGAARAAQAVAQAAAPQARDHEGLAAMLRRRAELTRRWMQAAEADPVLVGQLSGRADELERQARDAEQGRATPEALLSGLEADLASLGADTALPAQQRAALTGQLQQLQQQALDLDAWQRTTEAAAQDASARHHLRADQAARDIEDRLQGEPTELADTLEREATQGAAEGAAAATDELGARLWRRRSARTFASLPQMSPTRIFTQEPAPTPTFDQAFGPQDGQEPPGPGGMWGQVHRRLGRQSAAGPSPGPDLARLGRLIEHSARRISAQATEDARGLAPRMSGMPGNIFADLSSPMMQQIYMPALARVAGVRPAGGARAAKAPWAPGGEDRELVKDLASPQAVYHALLGEAGQRLWQENPEAAERLEASLKPVARLIPGAGLHALNAIRSFTQDMSRRVESWLGQGSTEGIERGRNQPVLTETGGAARTIGDYIGDIFNIEAFGAGASTAKLVRDQSAEVEKRLMAERRVANPGLLDKVSKLIGKAATGGAVTQFMGPTAGSIAREMGARAFSIGNAMFMPDGTPQAVEAHEMVHALEGKSDDNKQQIRAEEQVAYNVQSVFEQGEKKVQHALTAARDRMELAKEKNIPAMRLPDEPGGTAGTTAPDPGQRQINPKEQAQKEEQVLEAITDAVERMIDFDMAIEEERFSRIS